MTQRWDFINGSCSNCHHFRETDNTCHVTLPPALARHMGYESPYEVPEVKTHPAHQCGMWLENDDG